MFEREGAMPDDAKAIYNNRDIMPSHAEMTSSQEEATRGDAMTGPNKEEEHIARELNESALSYSASLGFPPFVLDP